MTLELIAIPLNPAIKRARELLKTNKGNRELKEKIEKAKKLFHTYLQCTKCRKKGIQKKYHKDKMLHVPYRTIRKGRMLIIYHHLCPEHAKNYRPQSERAAHVNGV